jgi:hypothetical protein
MLSGNNGSLDTSKRQIVACIALLAAYYYYNGGKLFYAVAGWDPAHGAMPV